MNDALVRAAVAALRGGDFPVRTRDEASRLLPMWSRFDELTAVELIAVVAQFDDQDWPGSLCGPAKTAVEANPPLVASTANTSVSASLRDGEARGRTGGAAEGSAPPVEKTDRTEVSS